MRPPAFVETATESTVQTMDLTVDASDKVGGTTTARCFCTSAMLEGTSPGGRLTVPLLTVKRTDHAAAQQQARNMQRLDQLLERLDDGIADGSAKNKVTFSIHREAANDDFEWGQTMASCTPAETAEAQRIIVSFLRSHVFDVLAAMADDLASVHGRFYLFDPFIKSRQGDTVNPRWHQDGYSLVTQDDFFAHWYLPAAEPAAGTGSAATSTGLAADDWAEVALPERRDEAFETRYRGPRDSTLPPAPSDAGGNGEDDGEDDDEELVFDWSGASDDTRKERIAPQTFVPLSHSDAGLIVLHDAEVFHRVPLAALFRRPERSIARVEFHGRDGKGDKVFFERRVDGGGGGEWQPLRRVRLPPALAALCDEYAGERACGDGNDGLRAYVSVGVCGAEAEMPMKEWLEGRLRRQYALVVDSSML